MQIERQPRSSLLLATVDCLRGDHTGFGGYAIPTTPFLDSVAAEGLTFPTAIVGGTPTYYSFPTLFASRSPLVFGRDVIGLAPQEFSLPVLLRSAGYATAAFVAGNPYLTRHFGYDQGFDTFCDFMGPGEVDRTEPSRDRNTSTVGKKFRSQVNLCLAKTSEAMGLASLYEELYFRVCQRKSNLAGAAIGREYPAADQLVDSATEWLQTNSAQPFFLWLHFMDTHAPYCPSADALAALGHPEIEPEQLRYFNAFWNRNLPPARLRPMRDSMIALYDSGLRWVDEQLNRLIAHLKQLSLWQNTAFVFTADHGEEFLELGGRYHSPPQLYDEMVRVPLLLRVPGVPGRMLPDAPFSLLNLSPTLLDILRIKSPDSFEGHSIWPVLQMQARWSGPAIVEAITGCSNPFRALQRMGARLLAVREEQFKLILDCQNGTEQLFDLHSDPHEMQPLPHNAEKAVRIRLLEHARTHFQNVGKKRDPVARADAKLRDLKRSLAVGNSRVKRQSC